MPEAAKLDWRTIIKVSDDSPQELVDRLDAYFEPFAQPPLEERDIGMIRSHNCLNCGEPQLGLLFGRFQWGLVHGEGICGECGWPARLYHNPKDDEGELFSLSLLLQYHPNFVTKKNAKEGEAA